jgi:hypothetical protein
MPAGEDVPSVEIALGQTIGVAELQHLVGRSRTLLRKRERRTCRESVRFAKAAGSSQTSRQPEMRRSRAFVADCPVSRFRDLESSSRPAMDACARGGPGKRAGGADDGAGPAGTMGDVFRLPDGHGRSRSGGPRADAEHGLCERHARVEGVQIDRVDRFGAEHHTLPAFVVDAPASVRCAACETLVSR